MHGEVISVTTHLCEVWFDRWWPQTVALFLAIINSLCESGMRAQTSDHMLVQDNAWPRVDGVCQQLLGDEMTDAPDWSTLSLVRNPIKHPWDIM